MIAATYCNDGSDEVCTKSRCAPLLEAPGSCSHCCRYSYVYENITCILSSRRVLNTKDFLIPSSIAVSVLNFAVQNRMYAAGEVETRQNVEHGSQDK